MQQRRWGWPSVSGISICLGASCRVWRCGRSQLQSGAWRGMAAGGSRGAGAGQHWHQQRCRRRATAGRGLAAAAIAACGHGQGKVGAVQGHRLIVGPGGCVCLSTNRVCLLAGSAIHALRHASWSLGAQTRGCHMHPWTSHAPNLAHCTLAHPSTDRSVRATHSAGCGRCLLLEAACPCPRPPCCRLLLASCPVH